MDSEGSRQIHSPDVSRVVAERRTHPRYLEEVRVRYRDLEGWAPSSWGRTRDIGLGGLCLITPAVLQDGVHLALEIHIESEPAPVLALGRVLRSVDEGGAFASGIQFLWVSAEDRANLYRLADYFRTRYGTGDSEPE
jgi:hypothetical protein